MGKRPAPRQRSPLWATPADLLTSAGHPFYECLNRVPEEAGFAAFVERQAEAGLLPGKTVGIDATTLEANAAMRSIERRDTGESDDAAETVSGCEKPSASGC